MSTLLCRQHKKEENKNLLYMSTLLCRQHKKEENKNLLYMSTLLCRQHKKEKNKNLLYINIGHMLQNENNYSSEYQLQMLVRPCGLLACLGAIGLDSE
jgi:hypothetical protein